MPSQVPIAWLSWILEGSQSTTQQVRLNYISISRPVLGWVQGLQAGPLLTIRFLSSWEIWS